MIALPFGALENGAYSLARVGHALLFFPDYVVNGVAVPMRLWALGVLAEGAASATVSLLALSKRNTEVEITRLALRESHVPIASAWVRPPRSTAALVARVTGTLSVTTATLEIDR